MSTLSWLQRELPRLAEVPVSKRFTRDVLTATLPRHILIRRWWRNHGAAWVQRPRFAMEVAYAALLIVVLVLGAFSTPVAALPQKGLEWVQPEPDTPSVWTRAGDSLGTFWDRFASLLESVAENQDNSEESP